MSCAPIALFAYNRPEHLRRTLQALQANELADRSDLIVFADGAKGDAPDLRVREVRERLADVSGFRSVVVHQRARNAGLATSIMEGVTQVCRDHGRVIVLEDDMVTSRWFLRYMNEALELYAAEERVASVHGYCLPIDALPETFFLRGADCWGWGTWQRAWQGFERDGRQLLQQLQSRGLEYRFDFDGAYGYTQMLREQIAGANDSWAVRWHASCFLQDQLTLHPGRSLVHNIGNDASGTHGGATDSYATRVAADPVRVTRIELAESVAARRAFGDFLRGRWRGLLRRIIEPVVSLGGLLR